MKTRRNLTEKGQSIVLIALMFLAFTAILALVLDGGIAYASRRRAQNAADAGALAGASYMCEFKDASGGITKAQEFAVKNGALYPPVVYANYDAGTVIVTATVQTESFFAGLIGYDQLAPRAVAEARCRPPQGMGVLPVGWSCHETVVTGEIYQGVCDDQIFGPCVDAGDPYGLDCTFVIMDSIKVKSGGRPCDPDITDPTHPDYCYEQNDLVCDDPDTGGIDPGSIDCDLNNDGINELIVGGSRSWLDLNGGGGGASELSGWITSGYPYAIQPHTWIPEQSGVATSIFDNASSVVGSDITLPVYNKVCNRIPNTLDTSDPESLDACTYADYDDLSLAQSGMNFHIVTFSKFHVTCVQTARNRVWSEPSLGLRRGDSCPGHDAAERSGSIDANDKSIEGYYVEGPIYGYAGAGDWVHVGTFVVVLVR